MKKNALLIALVVAALVIGGVLYAAKQSGRSPLPIDGKNGSPETAAENEVLGLSFESHSGETVSLGDFSGTPMVVNAWATWCPFCVDELPDFADAQKEFGERVVIIAINREEPLSQAQSYAEDLGIEGDLVFLLDPDDTFYRTIGGFAMPETLFIDAEGNTVFHKRGPMDQDEIRERIQNIL